MIKDLKLATLVVALGDKKNPIMLDLQNMQV